WEALEKPAWLSFDDVSNTFSGVADAVGTYTVRLKASDGEGSAYDLFTIRVVDQNKAPTVQNSVASQSGIQQGDTVFFQFAANTFADENSVAGAAYTGDSLSYEVSLLGQGSAHALPDGFWLQFDADTRTFSGQPGNDDVGTWSVRLTAIDTLNESVSTTFSFTVENVNDAPTLEQALEDKSVVLGNSFKYTIPSSAFADVDSQYGDKLHYTATNLETDSEGNYKSLPSWLQFDEQTGTFNGTPTSIDEVQSTYIQVSAIDQSGKSVSDTFRLQVAKDSSGILLDSKVVGLNYVIKDVNNAVVHLTAGDSGLYKTQSDGSFQFKNTTDTIHFYLGDPNSGISLGSAKADSYITPIDLAGSSNTTALTNMLRLLQSLDAQGSTADGIQIDSTVLTASNGKSLNFSLTESDFTVQANQYLTAMNTALGVPNKLSLVSSESAWSHFIGTLESLNSSRDPQGVLGSEEPFSQIAIQDKAFSYQLSPSLFGLSSVRSYTVLSLDGKKSGAAALAGTWLSFDTQTGLFSGKPGNSDVGAQAFMVVAQGAGKSTVSQLVDFTVLNVNDAPSYLSGSIQKQSTLANKDFVYKIPGTAFTDKDLAFGDKLTYKAQLLVNGVARDLATTDWLKFDADNGIFTGTPTSTGNVLVKLIATDNAGAAVSSVFEIDVTRSNSAPVLNKTIGNLTATEDGFFKLQLVNNVSDADLLNATAGEALTYAAKVTGSNNNNLGWLTFDPLTQTFSGTPGRNDVGSLNITLTVTDKMGAKVSDTFVIDVKGVHHTPTYDSTHYSVESQLSNRTVKEGDSLNFKLHPQTFIVDPGDKLQYTALVKLPGESSFHALDSSIVGLTFDGESGTFTGKPKVAGALEFQITATDTSFTGANSTTINFTMNVAAVNHAPQLDSQVSLANVAVSDGLTTPYTFNLPTAHFVDTDANDHLAFTATLLTGGVLPSSWLTFNPTQHTFTVAAGAGGYLGNLGIKVTATDDARLSVSDSFYLTVTHQNHAPSLNSAYLPARIITNDKATLFQLDSRAFTDVDAGDKLTYTYKVMSGGSDITSSATWLSFDANTRSFSLSPTTSTTASVSVVVTAKDSYNATTEGSFDLTLINSNHAPVLGTLTGYKSQTLSFDSTNERYQVEIQALESRPTSGSTVAGIFYDQDANDPLAVSAVNALNNTALPSWLHSDYSTSSGKMLFWTTAEELAAVTSTASSLSVKLVAKDQGGLSISDSFSLTIPAINKAPLVKVLTPDQVLTENSVKVIQLASNTFADPNPGDTLTVMAKLLNQSGSEVALPSWLKFDSKAMTFTALPTAGSMGSYTIVLTATDSGTPSKSVSDSFVIDVQHVNTAPVVANPIGKLTIQQGVEFTHTVTAAGSTGLFNDADLGLSGITEQLSYAISKPAWLTFTVNSDNTLTFSTASDSLSNEDVGSYSVTLTATDASGAKIYEIISLTVADTPEQPLWLKPVASEALALTIGEDFSFTIPSDSFMDPDKGDVVSIEPVDMPSWLHFDALSQTFSGIAPTGTAVGDVIVTMNIKDLSGQYAETSASFTINLQNLNHAPVLTVEGQEVVSQQADETHPLSLTTATWFTDIDSNDTLTYSANLDGEELDAIANAWLSIDSDTGLLSTGDLTGVTGTHVLRVTATDSSGSSTAVVFQMVVNNQAPVAVDPFLENMVLQTGELLYVNVSDYFTDADLSGGDQLEFSATVNSTTSPSWLHLENGILSASSSELAANPGAYQIELTATDLSGATATGNVTVFVGNHAPTINSALLPDRSLDFGDSFNLTISSSLYGDVDSWDLGNLSYTITGIDGGALPSWLTYDANSHTVSGTASSDYAGATTVELHVTDMAGVKSTEQFVLTVENINDVPQVHTPLPDQTIFAGQSFSFTMDAATFSDADLPYGDSLSYSVSGPAWLQFTPSGDSILLSGVAPTGSGSATVTVFAVDQAGQSVSDSFTVTYLAQEAVSWSSLSRSIWNGGAEGENLAIDSHDNVYISGNFFGNVALDFGPDSSEFVRSGADAALVEQRDVTGHLQWAVELQQMGSGHVDAGMLSLSTENGHDYLYSIGRFAGSLDVDSDGISDITSSLTSSTGRASNDLYVLKIDSQYGDIVWKAAVGDANNQDGGVILVNGDSAVVFGVTQGQTLNPDGTLPQNLFAHSLSTSTGQSTGVSDVNIAWSADKSIEGVSLDHAGHLFVVGQQATSLNSGMGYVTSIDLATGSIAWNKSFAGTNVAVTDLISDGAGHLYVAGTFANSIHFDDGTTSGQTIESSSEANKGFVARLDGSGVVTWATAIGLEDPINLDQRLSLVLTDTGLLVAGTNSVSDSTGFHEHAITFSLDLEGTVLWQQEIEGNQSRINDLVVDSQGNPIITGSLSGQNFIGSSADQSSLKIVNGGQEEQMFVVKLEGQTGNLLDSGDDVVTISGEALLGETLTAMVTIHGWSAQDLLPLFEWGYYDSGEVWQPLTNNNSNPAEYVVTTAALGQAILVRAYDDNDYNYELESAATAVVTVGNHAPEVHDFARAGNATDWFRFKADAFSGHVADQDGDNLVSIMIDQLPSAAAGVLQLHGVAVGIEQEIALADLNDLVFVPTAGWTAPVQFSWQAFDGQNWSSQSAVVTLNPAAVPATGTVGWSAAHMGISGVPGGSYGLDLAVGGGSVYVVGGYQGSVQAAATTLPMSATSSGFLQGFSTGGSWSSTALAANGAATITGIQFVNEGANNYLYVSGTFSGTLNPGAGSGRELTSAGGLDLFVEKFTTSGTLQWAQQLGGTGNENGQIVKIDTASGVLQVGWGNMVDPYAISGAEAHLTQLSIVDGAVGSNTVMSTEGSINTTMVDTIRSVLFDKTGNMVVMGNHTLENGSVVPYVEKIGSDQSLWYKVLNNFNSVSDTGAAISVMATDMVINKSGNIYLTGMMSNGKLFIENLDGKGEQQWHREYAGNVTQVAMTMDSNGELYLTGSFVGQAHLGNTLNSVNGGSDIFVAKLDHDGRPLWARSFGGQGMEQAGNITVDSSGNIYVTATVAGTADLDPGSGNLSVNTGSDLHSVVLKLNNAGMLDHLPSGLVSLSISGSTLTVNSQLSDADGLPAGTISYQLQESPDGSTNWYNEGTPVIASSVSGAGTATMSAPFLQSGQIEMGYTRVVASFTDALGITESVGSNVLRVDYNYGISTTDSLALGASKSGMINYQGDSDWVSISLQAGQSYTYRLSSMNQQAIPELLLRDASGQIVMATESSNAGVAELIFMPSSTGTYFLEAQFQHGTMGQQYTLQSVYNFAPTLSQFTSSVAQTGQEAESVITYADLLSHSDAADANNDLSSFVVQSVLSGTLKIGGDMNTATAYQAGVNDTIDATHHAYWTPAQGSINAINAFTVVAKDAGGLQSTTPIAVPTTILVLNDAPSFVQINPNIAQGKSVVGVSLNGNDPQWGVAKLVDGSYAENGNPSDYWLSPEDGSWVQVDLGQSHLIDKIDLINTHNGGSNERSTQNWRLQIFNADSIQIYTVDGTMANTGALQLPAGAPLPVTTVDIPDTMDGRYVRFTVLTHYDAGGGLSELLVYGAAQAPSYVENSQPVALLPTLHLHDPELDTANNYDGSTLTLARQGGVNSDDHFSAASGSLLDALNEGGGLFYDGLQIGVVVSNSAGILELRFNDNATASLVNSILPLIQYSNAAVDPSNQTVAIDVIFNDGNLGEQGSGGAQTVTHTVSVAVSGDNIPTNHGASFALASHNIALNKTVTGVSYNDSYAPSKIVDGSALEATSPGDYWLTPDASTGSAQINLGGVHSINKIEFLNTHNSFVNDRTTQDWSLQIFDAAMQVVYSTYGTQGDLNLEAGMEIPVNTLTFAPVLGQYVQFNVLSYWDLGGGLSELRVFENAPLYVENGNAISLSPTLTLHDAELDAVD
ncbi:putative Ig domain-containing protein, partial [Candidatus Magnetaquicoccus inordinatus]|uniref:putative Ig domain-containing protein n=1 Tax=Candidatus Magnetaquicoccus inordinatus TaxID=2496818 RepID=UPI00187D3F01